MSVKTPADKKAQAKPVVLSTGRGGSGNIRRVKSTKEITSRPLASPKMLELEPPRNRAAYGGRGGSGNTWTHVIEEGVFDRVLSYEISRARVLKEERAHEKAERRRSGNAARARSRSQSDAKPATTDSRSLMSTTSRKSWVSTSEGEQHQSPQSPERRKSFANSLLAPLRNTFRSSSHGVRPTSELGQCSSEFGHSPPSSDRASLSGLSDHPSPSTPNLSPVTPGPPIPLRRRWTASGHRTSATERSLASTRHLSNPLPPPRGPIPPIPHVHFVPRPANAPPVPMQKPIPTDYTPSTPVDDSYGLLQAAAIAASKARPKARPMLTLTPPVSFPEHLSTPGYAATGPPSRPLPTTAMYALSRSARSTSAIHSRSRAESSARLERPTANGSEGDLIDPYLLSEADDGRCSVRAPYTAAPTVSSLSSILPWLQDHDLDSLMPALAHAE